MATDGEALQLESEGGTHSPAAVQRPPLAVRRDANVCLLEVITHRSAAECEAMLNAAGGNVRQVPNGQAHTADRSADRA